MAAVTIGLVRWNLFDRFPDDPPVVESERLDGLVARLATHYRLHDDWSFLPAGAAARATWLRDELVRSRQAADGIADANPLSRTLGYRIGLLDRERRPLAGAIAHRLTVAFASIDRVQTPLLVDHKLVGYLVRAQPQRADDGLAVAFLIDQQDRLLAIALIGVSLSVLTAAALAATIRKPIGQLVAGARRLEAGRFEARLDSRRRDEFGELAQTFDHLARRLEQTESSRRQWVADTSHELRTPLSVLRGQLEALQDGTRTGTPENLALLLRQVMSLTRLVDELHEMARADVGALRCVKDPVEVWPLVQEELDGFSENIRVAGLGSTIGGAPLRSTVNCDADRIRQVLRNVLDNAVRHTAAGGRIAVDGAVIDDELHIVIDDSAPGVPPSSLGRLGERFFRVESSRSRRSGGAGLGLALSRQLVEAHDGRLVFDASPLGGLRARIVLKLVR